MLQSSLDQRSVAFAFLTHRSAQENITQVVLHSFLFQLITDNKALRPVLAYHHENNYRKLVGSHTFVRDLIRDILTNLSTTYFVVDGLDEIVETERLILLSSLQTLQEDSPNLKLLISSRVEYDINASLKSRCHKLCVHRCNSRDISDYVFHRTETWLGRLSLAPELIFDIKHCTEEIAPKSEGMYF